MIKIYHNPRCKKSRAGLAYLESKTTDFQIVKYLDDPLSKEQLEKIIHKTGKKAEQLIRKQEKYYKENLKGKSPSGQEWLDHMVAQPKLIARPIVETDDKAVVADPPEEIDQII